MIWETRLVTLYSVSRVNHLSRFATAPPAGALAALPLTGGCRAERDWGGAPKASVSARRNSKCANIWTQKARFASVSAHGRRFGAHLGTQKEERTWGGGEAGDGWEEGGTEMRPE